MEFLLGAKALNAASLEGTPFLQRPTLALAGHGLEMMLKACCYVNGRKPPSNGKKGHDIAALWQDDICLAVRLHVYIHAGYAVEEARLSGMFPDVPEDDEAQTLIEEYVKELCRLHGGTAGYPLRYPHECDEKAPPKHFVVDALCGAADDMAKSLSEFDLRHLREGA
ncbi:hypothetical protein SAMN04487972_11112 [Paracoccus halophilus]|nr:hypothetical protein [Paracoccus halophilus]SFA53504.1 hypothetical protein SAMN04487972_11112 [Paracoccus halophilus]